MEIKKKRASGEGVSKREGLFCFNVFESGICGQLVLFFFFFSLPPLFTQSVRRHTRACLDWVFAPEPGQGFQHRTLALPPRRHQEAPSVTRPHGASSLSAYPPFTPSALPAHGPQQPWGEAACWVDITFRTRAFGGQGGGAGAEKEREGGRVTDPGGDAVLEGSGVLKGGSVMKLAVCGPVPGLGR